MTLIHLSSSLIGVCISVNLELFSVCLQKYKGTVMENKADVLVLRIPVQDKDKNNTPNWRAVYEITKGNESGNFIIKTDPVTNEGLVYVTKVRKQGAFCAPY